MKGSRAFGYCISLTAGLFASSSCLAQAAGEAAAPAAQAADAVDVGDEIVVTATKREERLQDVPISIVAIGGEDLRKRQIATLDDLSQSVPGLSYNNMGSNRYYSIRGISNLIGNAPLVGIYLDEADVTLGGFAATQVNPTTYDLERVEVLRGPQGTLYGQGSAGGTVRFVTRNPDLNDFDAMGDATALFTKNGSASGRFNAAVNIPLIADTLAVRVVGTLMRDGGWIDQPAAGKKNINSNDLSNLRVKALWQVTPDFTANAMVIINRSERGSDVTDSGNRYEFTQNFNQTTTPRVTNDYDLYNLTLTYDLPGARILNTSTYLRVFSEFENQSSLYQLTPPDVLPPFHYYAPLQFTNNRQFTNELRISSSGSGPWQWQVGAYYRHYKDETTIPNNYFDLPFSPTLPAPYSTGLQTIYNSGSAFLDTSYEFFDQLKVGVGIRYFEDHQDFTDRVANVANKKTFSSVDPRFYAQFKFNRNAMIYASVAKGFRSGGFNKGNRPAYDPESVWTYELGAKAKVLDGALAFDVSLFQSDYTDYQIFGVIDANTGQNFVSNIGTARIKGLEWDFTVRPTKGFQFGVSGNYVDAKFTKINATQTAFLPGDRVNLIPDYQFVAFAQYDYMIGDRTGFVRIDYNQQGRKESRDRSVGPWYIGQSDTIGLLNFSSSIDLTPNISAGVFAQNLTNEQGFVNPFDYIGAGVRPRPQTFGITLGVKM